MTNLKVGDEVYSGTIEHGVITYIYSNKSCAVIQNDKGDENTLLVVFIKPFPKSAARNPHAPDFALTLDDIKPGVKLRRVCNGSVGESVTVMGEVYASKHGLGHKVSVARDRDRDNIFISDYGIEPIRVGGNDWYRGGNVYSIPDTTDAVLKVLQK